MLIEGRSSFLSRNSKKKGRFNFSQLIRTVEENMETKSDITKLRYSEQISLDPLLYRGSTANKASGRSII